MKRFMGWSVLAVAAWLVVAWAFGPIGQPQFTAGQITITED